MDAAIDLEAADGRALRLALPERGAGDGFFVICTEYGGYNEFWVLLERLAAAGRQAVWTLHDSLQQHDLTFGGGLTQAARRSIFSLQG